MVQAEAECLTQASFVEGSEESAKAPSSLYGHCSLQGHHSTRTDLQHVKLPLSLGRAKWQGVFFIEVFCITTEAQVTYVTSAQPK